MIEPWYTELPALAAVYAAGIDRCLDNARSELTGPEWLKLLEALADRLHSLRFDWEQHDDDAFPTPGPDTRNDDDFVVLCERCQAALEAAADGADPFDIE